MRTYNWNGQTHEISKPGLTDIQVASEIRMLSRTDLCHEPIVCMARDRIMCLVFEKEELQIQLTKEIDRAIEYSAALQDKVDRLDKENKEMKLAIAQELGQ